MGAQTAVAAKTQLESLLRTVNQGDVMQYGAVTLSGQGPAPTSVAERVAESANQVDITDSATGIWSVTLKSDIGWYVVCSQDCDIVRSTEQEPCILVCPLMAVPESRWGELRRGPYSPREFPYPDDVKLRAALPEGTRAVADVRYLTSMLKHALVGDDVEILRPLTAMQKTRFSSWLARRVSRAAFSDRIQSDVLDVAASRLRELSKQYDRAKDSGQNPSLSARLIRAVEEWYVAGGEKRIEYKALITERLARDAGFWDDKLNVFREVDLEAACRALVSDLRKRLPDNGGYLCDIAVRTYDSVSLSEYRSWSVWVWERSPDVLGD